MKFLFCACIMLIYSSAIVQAQRIPERFFVINPLAMPISGDVIAKAVDSSCVWMSGFGFWSGFERYAISDNAHAWRNPFGAYAEIVRWRTQSGKQSNIYAIGTFEHVADPNNDISFNPRAVWWEEGIAYSTELDSVRLGTMSAPSYLHIGYYHRCRHEVDNLFRGESRVMIYGSLTGKYVLDFRSTEPAERFTTAVRTDIYTIRTDYRYPFIHTNTLPSYFDLVGSLGLNLNYRNSLPWKQLGWYAGARVLTTCYAGNREFFGRFGAINAARVDYGATLGISVEGAVRCNIGLHYEYLGDPEMKPFPQPQHLLSVGFMFMSPVGL
jgi:hypothetical protein